MKSPARLASFRTFGRSIEFRLDWRSGSVVLVFDNRSECRYHAEQPTHTTTVEHIAEHGLSQEDVQYVFDNPSGFGVSRSSGEDVVFGFTPDGRYIACVFQAVDDATVYPITAFDVPEPRG